MGCGDKTTTVAQPAVRAKAAAPARKGKPLLADVVLSAPGVGTELAKLLAEVKFDFTADCRCLEYARRMNSRGISWCERNVFLISTFLEDSASRRGLPFDRDLAVEVIGKAIENARIPEQI